MTIFRTASYTIRPESIDVCTEAIRQIIANTKAHEPDTLMYLVLQEAEKPTNFVHISAYSDTAALQRHVTGETMLTLIREIISPAMVNDPVFTHYTVVDTTMSPMLITGKEF